MLPRAVSEHYRAQQRLIVAALGLTRREWSTMGGDWDASWAKIAPRVNLLTASAQLGAASSGAAYVADTLAEYGDDVVSLADVNPRAFAGIASDGRPLGSLLDGALFQSKSANSLEAGGKWLDMVVHTQIADAGRGAAATAIAVRPGVGWVRMVNPPCCGPCAVLAGREYRYSHGFQRHPRCDCVHVPTTLANPGSHFGVDPSLDQITDLTEGERKALLEGSDLSRVINARRGGGVGKMHTTALAKRGRARLTPDGIFATAKDRDEALRLLKDHGYITPTARKVSTAATRPVVAAPRLADVVGEVRGITADLVPERLDEAASTLADLTERYGVPVHRFEIGNTASHGRTRAIGDSDRAGNMNITRKAFDAKWETWERFTKQAAERGSVTSPHSQLVNTITHEYGHLIDFATDEKLSVGRIQKALARELGISNSDYDLWLSRQMSQYARTKRVEAIAEAFADAELNGPNATELSKRIHGELIRLLRQKVEPTPAPKFGRTLDAVDGSTKPLKGHGPGRPLTADEYNEAPSVLADYEYHYIADPNDRATAILQYNCDTEQWAKAAARNIKAGRDPFDGIDLEAPQQEGFVGKTLSDAHLRGDRYTLEDLRADIEGTARKLIEWESRTEDLGTAYKGMNFDMDLSWDDVRALLDFRGLSYNSVASDLNTASLYAGRADRSKSVYVHFVDARGIRLDSVGGHASKTESLITGDFEIVSTRIEPDGIGYGDVMIVNVRRVAG